MVNPNKVKDYDDVTRSYVRDLLEKDYRLEEFPFQTPCPGCSCERWALGWHEANCSFRPTWWQRLVALKNGVKRWSYTFTLKILKVWP